MQHRLHALQLKACHQICCQCHPWSLPVAATEMHCQPPIQPFSFIVWLFTNPPSNVWKSISEPIEYNQCFWGALQVWTSGGVRGHKRAKLTTILEDSRLQVVKLWTRRTYTVEPQILCYKNVAPPFEKKFSLNWIHLYLTLQYSSSLSQLCSKMTQTC